MTRDLRTWIEKLESQMPHQPNELEIVGRFFQRFLVIAVACYLGNPTPEDSCASAYARALGYASFLEFQIALRAAAEVADPDLDARVSVANRQLLSKFGVSPDDEGAGIFEACQRMAAGLPEFYVRHVHWAAKEFGVDVKPWFGTEN
jgi:hypothetical protein